MRRFGDFAASQAQAMWLSASAKFGDRVFKNHHVRLPGRPSQNGRADRQPGMATRCMSWRRRWRGCLRAGSDTGKMDRYDIRKTSRREMPIRVQSTEDQAMRTPRVRLREFLLIITLASLVTAAFAIRARTASHLSAQDHAFHARQARLMVNWWEDRLNTGKRELETNPLISEDRFARCDLRMMSPVNDIADIPTKGKDLIIIADLPDMIVFRMFDGDGKVFDWVHGMNPHKLKRQFAGLWPPIELTGIEKARVITAVRSVVSNTVRTNLRSIQAGQAKAVAEAEYHESQF
jgi:hypothetical protein